MHLAQQQVEHFHHKLGLPANAAPTEPDETTRHLRAALILEETLEVLRELGYTVTVSDYGPELEDLPPSDGIGIEPEPVNLPKLAKELCDLLYVVYGTAVTLGLDIQPLFTAVHQNNLTKAGGPIRADGKRMKPDGYQPVDLTHLVTKQSIPDRDHSDDCITYCVVDTDEQCRTLHSCWCGTEQGVVGG